MPPAASTAARAAAEARVTRTVSFRLRVPAASSLTPSRAGPMSPAAFSVSASTTAPLSKRLSLPRLTTAYSFFHLLWKPRSLGSRWESRIWPPSKPLGRLTLLREPWPF